jgi:RimJ/RimL family protein N-acetyltransferase
VARIRIEGERFTLRPLSLDELDAMVASRRLNRVAEQDREKLRARIERSGLLENGRLDLAMDVGGTRIGEIQTYVPPDRELPPDVYEIGIAIDDPSLRGHGYGSEAVQLLVDWLFDREGAARVHLATRESNAAMRTVAERLGFAAGGLAHDRGVEYILYALTRDAWLIHRRSR